MKHHQIEAWSLKIIEQVEAHQPVEDSRVELKSEWIEAVKASKQIAGHANAARGESILWLIGVDQKKGVIGAEYTELANWYPQVQAKFDGLAPGLTDVNIMVKNKTIVALLFETIHFPFVIKNNGGEFTHAVYWREGTRLRIANRNELIQLLSPVQKLPNIEIYEAGISLEMDVPLRLSHWPATMNIEIYLLPRTENTIIIPLYRCVGYIEFLNNKIPLNLDFRSDTNSKSIMKTSSEIIIYNPGKLTIRSLIEFERGKTERLFDEQEKNNIKITLNLPVIGANQSICISEVLTYYSYDIEEEGISYSYLGWTFKKNQ